MQDEIKENNVKMYRESIGYTQDAFAKACGMNTATVGFTENRIHAPGVSTKRKMFEALVKLGALNEDGKRLKIQDVFPM